jgi:thiol-disulfide isomerase/thioredoxin
VGVAAAALLVVGVFAFVTLMRSYGSVLIRLDRIESALAAAGIEAEGDVVDEPEFGREPGTVAPAFATTSVTGEPVTLDSLLAPGLPALVLFTSPHCGPCKTLVPMAAEWQREYADRLTIAFAGDGAAEELRAEAEEFEFTHALVDTDGSLYRAFEANGTPSAVLIAPDGSIGSWVAAGSESIERLVARTLAPEPAETGLPVGTEVPALELPSLDGDDVSLATLRGRETLLLFWNPDCGYCRSMHEDLLARETATNGETPRLVVISSGDADSSRAEGFRSLVLLDEGFAAGAAFGVDGTPMAVLLGADGRVASSVAAGADAVLELAH